MKKIMSLILTTAILTSAHASSEIESTKINNDLNKKTESKLEKFRKHASDNKEAYVYGAAGVTLTAAALFDYYYNDANVMKNAAKIAKKFTSTCFDKTKSGTEYLAELVKKNPVIAISALSGAALISGVTYYEVTRGKDSKIRKCYDDSKESISNKWTTLKNKFNKETVNKETVNEETVN